jgi:hypothetical protein
MTIRRPRLPVDFDEAPMLGNRLRRTRRPLRETAYAEVHVRAVRALIVAPETAHGAWRLTRHPDDQAAHVLSRVMVELRTRPGLPVMGVEVTTTVPHLGGVRWWFSCPDCSARCASLFYVPGGGLVCRRCSGVTYASQRLSAARRLARTARRIRERLGGPPRLFEAVPLRPPRMHRRSYADLVAELERVEQEYLAMRSAARSGGGDRTVRCDAAGHG